MELLELILLLLAAVLVSTVVDQLLPRVSLPLVQIGIGAFVALVLGHSVMIDSELFLVLLIAPLLFDESRNANKAALWENKGSIVSLAVGLVLVLVLAVGFALHFIEPSIPLAAAFALGAALGPTDAVAVASLSKDVALSKRQEAQLSGEALINDASGVVSFQFAVAAATTGTFSLLDATGSFLGSFFGGIGLGLLLGLVALGCTRLIRERGCETVTAHVTFELFTPFVVFLTAESLGVSGILAVVAAGLLMSFAAQPVSALSTRISLTSSSVWEVLAFVANGVVFVMLGMELPQAILPGWNDSEMNNALVIGASLVITVVLVVVRYAWVLMMDAGKRDPKTGCPQGLTKAIARDAFVTTLAGPKGAVTLSIAFTLPMTVASGAEFPFRDTIICISSVVVLCTLLLANFLMPVVAPKKDESHELAMRRANIDILLAVKSQLHDRMTPANAQAMTVVLRSYDARLEQLRGPVVSDNYLRILSEQVLGEQKAYVERAVEEGRIGAVSGQKCIEQLARMTRILERHQGNREHRFNPIISARLRVHSMREKARALTRKEPVSKRDNLAFIAELEQCALDFLEPLTQMDTRGYETAKTARVLVAEHQAALSSLKARLDAQDANAARKQDPGATAPIRGMKSYTKRTVEKASDLYASALRMELVQIQQARENGVITKKAAQDMREEVYLLQMGLNENRS